MHLIEFRWDSSVPIEQGNVTTDIDIRKGVQCPANVRCYVGLTDDGYVEAADIETSMGTVRGLPCEAFMFIDCID